MSEWVIRRIDADGKPTYLIHSTGRYTRSIKRATHYKRRPAVYPDERAVKVGGKA